MSLLASPNPKPSEASLLGLPQEVRDLVFDFILTQTDPITPSNLPQFRQSCSARLLQACRQLHHEGRQHLYKHNTFLITGPCDDPTALDTVGAEWNVALSPQQLTSAGIPLYLVERLVLVIDLERFDDLWPGLWTVDWSVLNLLEEHMPNLRKLVMVLGFSASSSLIVRDEKRAAWEAEGSELLRKLLEPVMAILPEHVRLGFGSVEAVSGNMALVSVDVVERFMQQHRARQLDP